MSDQRRLSRLRRLRKAVSMVLYERRLGVTTAEGVELEDLGLAAEGRMGYEPLEWGALRRVLGARDVGPDDVFVDFGAGMGRAVLLAAQLPLRRVEGVEISERLATIASINLQSMRAPRRCQDARIVCSDVLEYPVPDDLSIAFLNNPFTGDIFQCVLDRLLASHDRAPRRLRIVYRNPMEHERIMATGRVTLTRASEERRWDGRSRKVLIHVYEVLPENDAAPGAGTAVDRATLAMGP